jgi:transcriptional regulator with XRE-family HTH domain
MIGTKLRKLFQKKHMRNKDFCLKYEKVTGEKMLPARLSNYANNIRTPDLKTLAVIANILEVDLNYFSPVELTHKGCCGNCKK